MKRRSPRGRKPRVLWGIAWDRWPKCVTDVYSKRSYAHSAALDVMHECSDTFRIVKFVEAPRRKRSPRGKKEKKP